MSIYLAWSVYKLSMSLIILLGGSLMVLWFNTTKPRTKPALLTFAVGFVIIMLAALNIGDRQADLKRQRFDAKPPEQVERVEAVPRRDIKQVQEAFESAVKRTN